VHLHIESFFDPATASFTHLILDRATRQCAIVDPVLDYDPKSGRTRTESAERLATRIAELGAEVQWILETHVHADHLSAAAWLREQVGGQIAIGKEITTVQKFFATLFHLEPSFRPDGSQFDHLFADNEMFAIGTLRAKALHTPGHTPVCTSYLIEAECDGHVERALFVGDTLFMPDVGTARCDFPGGNAATLYQSIQRMLTLPPETKLYLCHDYPPAGRAPTPVCTVADQRRGNIHIHDGISAEEFVAMRRARDATLEMPTLFFPALQVNIRAGALPPPEANGIRYLKIPVNAI